LALFLNKGYETRKFNSSASLVFSKSATDNLPITQTRTESKPCMDSLYQSISEN